MERELAVAKAKLAEMESAGYAEKFGKAAMPGDIRDFRKTSARLSESEEDVSGWKAHLAELKAQGNGKCEEARRLAEAIREGSAEISNLADLLARQKQVPGFWIPPRAVYTRTLAEVRVLEGRIEQRANLVAVSAQSNADRRLPRQERQIPCAVPVAPPPAPTPAVDKWTAHLQDGKTFYHNETTGESTWSLPVGVKRPMSTGWGE